ncbi:hypothetical protein MKW92_023374 [Papaver armeniacum]|nr:hypothetical protein MKW92_023374 [Papaver armeniacum]
METGTAAEQLNASNYENWKLRVQEYLARQDLWGIVDGSETQPQIPSQQADDDQFKTWMSKNAIALQVIKLSCGTEMLSHITYEDSAKAAWEKLATANSNFLQPANNSNGNQAITEQIDEDNDYTLHVALYKAINKNDWESAKEHLKYYPNAVSAKITSTGETALHIAANSGRVHLVEKLVELMPKEALEIKNHSGVTALSITASQGCTKIAKLMVEKNSNLLRIQSSSHNRIPLVVSAINGNKDLMHYLYSVTPKELLDPKNGENGAAFLTYVAEANIYDVALDVLQRYPQLATARDSEGMSIIHALAKKPSAFPSGNRYGFLQQLIYTSIPVELDYLFRDSERSQHSIQIDSEPNVQNFIKVKEHGRVWKALARLVPGVKQIHKNKVMHVQVMELLKVICPRMSNLNVQQISDAGAFHAIFYTTRFGIIEYFKEIINSCPHLMHSIYDDKGGIGLLQEAVLARQHNIYNFISQTGAMNDMVLRASDTMNNTLHLAGFLAPPSQLEKVSGAALQMQREIQWFQDVEQMVPPRLKELINDNGKTPRDVFREAHKALVKEGEAWMKETSQACMIVSTLIATVMFTAAFTVPGGNNGVTGTPIFSKTRMFYVFIIADAISLFCSCTSVLMFLAILTARYSKMDFLRSLPQKLILGLASLFISMVSMMTAFGATLVIVLSGSITWAYIPVALLASIPVLLFGMLQFPLFVDIVLSTYGPGIFIKKRYKNKED